MEKLSIYDAKAHFSRVIELAESGRATAITKRGRVVARIVPAREPAWDRTGVLDEVEALRRKLAVKKSFSVAELMAKGRL